MINYHILFKLKFLFHLESANCVEEEENQTNKQTKKKHRVHSMTSERDNQVKRLNPSSVMNTDHRSLHIVFFRLMFMGFEIKTVNKKRLRKSV